MQIIFDDKDLEELIQKGATAGTRSILAIKNL